MSFGKRTTSYGSKATAPIEMPYTLAAREWDNRIGSARVQERNRRHIAFTALTGRASPRGASPRSGRPAQAMDQGIRLPRSRRDPNDEPVRHLGHGHGRSG